MFFPVAFAVPQAQNVRFDIQVLYTPEAISFMSGLGPVDVGIEAWCANPGTYLVTYEPFIAYEHTFHPCPADGGVLVAAPRGSYLKRVSIAR